MTTLCYRDPSHGPATRQRGADPLCEPCYTKLRVTIDIPAMHARAAAEKAQAKQRHPAGKKIRKTYPGNCSLGACRCGACHLDPWEAMK